MSSGVLGWTVLILLFIVSPSYGQTFTRITDPTNPVVADPAQTSYEGASWIDFNNDGLLDLFVAGRSLYQNVGNGNFVSLPGAMTGQGAPLGHSWADYDNDGDLDCFITGGSPAGSSLYRNDGSGQFTRITTGDIGESLHNKGWSCAWGDYNNDGFVDLVIAAAFNFNGIDSTNRLFRNNGDGTFTRIDTTVITMGIAPYTVPSWSDYDNDGDIDLFIGSGPANGTLAPDNLYRNWLAETGTESFTRITTAPIATDLVDGQIWNWIDYDNDGDVDAFLTNYNSSVPNHLYRNDGGTFARMTPLQVGSIVSDVSGSLASVWADFDNDGDLDCFVTNEGNASNFYYRNNGNGTFTRLTTIAIVTGTGNQRGASAGDYDNDGDIDLMITGPSGSRGLYRNDPGNINSWINIRLVGVHANRAAIGARVRALANINGVGVWQLRDVSSQNSFDGMNMLNIHFGLGNAASIDTLMIEWPGGARDILTNVPANQFMTVTEGSTTDAHERGDQQPMRFQLYQNYPNPFNPSTIIRYETGERFHVLLVVYDQLGQEVLQLVNEDMDRGEHTVRWNGANRHGLPVAAGMYYIRASVSGFTQTIKTILLR
jgi:hypothetical protein